MAFLVAPVACSRHSDKCQVDQEPSGTAAPSSATEGCGSSAAGFNWHPGPSCRDNQGS